MAVLPAAFVPRLTGVATVPITDAPGRVGYAAWNRHDRTPAAAAFLEVLGVTDPRDTR